MRIEFDLAQLADLPWWTHLVGLGVAWYSAAGRVIRNLTRKDFAAGTALLDWTEGPGPFFVWLFSPVVPVFFTAWTGMAAISGGLVPPPWRKSIWE